MLQKALLILFFIRPQDDPRGLVEQLRSDSVVERDQAAKKLLGLGDGARVELEKAAKDPDAEVASRAARILRIMAIRGHVPPRLKAAIPGLEDRLATDHDRAWTEAFFAVAGGDRGRTPRAGVEREDLDFLAVRAFRGASSENERSSLCEIAGNRSLRSTIPELLRLLSDPSFKVQHLAWRALVDLDAREAAPELLKLLGGESKNVSSMVLRILVQLEAQEAAPGLIALLGSERDHVRANAAAALEAIGTVESAPALRPLLKDRSDLACRAAARAVGRLGLKEAVPDLVALLRETERDVQSGAAFALGKLGAKESVPELIAALGNPGKFDARDEVAVALGELCAKEALPPLLRLLEEKGFQGGARVLPVVVKLGGAAASPQILACLKHEERDVREAAIEAARALKVKGLGPALFALLEDTSDNVWQEAAEAIVETGAAEVAAPLQALALNETAKETSRRTAILVLGRGGVRSSIPFLRERLRDAKFPPGYVVCAAQALADLGAKEAVEDLRALVKAKDSEVATAAITALGRLGAKESAPEFRALLGDPAGPYDARRAAATALGVLGDREGVAVLRKVAEGDDFPGTAILALAALDDREAVPLALKLLDSRDEEERQKAADALGRLDPAAGLARLRERLKDPDPKRRVQAAIGLCRLGARDGVPTLLEAGRLDKRLSLFSLNAVRSPGRWKQLLDRRLAWVLPGGSIDTPRLIRITAGETLEAGEDGSSTWVFGNEIEMDWLPAIHMLEEYEQDAVLDEKHVRMPSRLKLVRFWEEWWRSEKR